MNDRLKRALILQKSLKSPKYKIGDIVNEIGADGIRFSLSAMVVGININSYSALYDIRFDFDNKYHDDYTKRVYEEYLVLNDEYVNYLRKQKLKRLE
jgi:hypothetical protein